MKIDRKMMKVFGINSGVEEVAVFGSLSEAVPEFSIDPDEIQKLATYEDGWFPAVFGNRSPTIEDRNGLDLVMTYQLAYLLQNGMPEYNGDTLYYKDQLSRDGKNTFISLIDDNDQPVSNRLAWVNKFKSDSEMSAFKNYCLGTDISGIGNFAIHEKDTHMISEMKLFGKQKEMMIVGLGKIFFGSTTSWTSITPTAIGILRGLISGDDVGIVYSQNPSSSTPIYLYNVDGTNWVVGPNCPNALDIRQSAFGNGVFILVAYETKVVKVESATPTALSVINTNIATNRQHTGIIFDEVNSRFVICGTRSGGPFMDLDIMISEDDGDTWTTIDITSLGLPSDFSLDKTRITYMNGLIFVYAETPTETFIINSIDGGDTWSIVDNSDALPFRPHTFLSCGDVLVATKVDELIGMVSKNGGDWEEFELGQESAEGIMSLAYSERFNKVYGVREDHLSISDAV